MYIYMYIYIYIYSKNSFIDLSWISDIYETEYIYLQKSEPSCLELGRVVSGRVGTWAE